MAQSYAKRKTSHNEELSATHFIKLIDQWFIAGSSHSGLDHSWRHSLPIVNPTNFCEEIDKECRKIPIILPVQFRCRIIPESVKSINRKIAKARL